MRRVPLKEVAPIEQAGGEVSGEVWEVGLQHVEPHTGRLLERAITQADDLGPSKVTFDECNVLYSKLRPYLNKVLLPDGFGVATSELVPLRPDPDRLDRRYLAHYLRSSSFVAFAESRTAGANLPRLSMRALRAHKVPLPPLGEQREIVDDLDRADAARAKQRRALAQLDALLAAVFGEMFGDPITNPKGWPTASVPALLRDVSRGQPRLKTSEYLDEGPVPVIDQGEADVSGYTDDPGLVADVPLPVVVFGDHTRRFKLVGFPFAVGAQGTKLLAPGDRLDPTFAYHQLRVLPLPSTGYARHYKFLKAKKLIVPPLAEQERFAEVVRRSDPLRQRLVQQGARLDALYAALAARAFRGEGGSGA